MPYQLKKNLRAKGPSRQKNNSVYLLIFFGVPNPLKKQKTPNLSQIRGLLVARTGFEPVISALRGQRPKPLDERASVKNLEVQI